MRKTLAIMLACLAAGAAQAETGVSFSGYLKDLKGAEEASVTVSILPDAGTYQAKTRVEANGYVCVVVPCEVPTNAVSAKWSFSANGGSKSQEVTQSLSCAPYALVAERAGKVVPSGRTLTVSGSLSTEAAEALKDLYVGTWGAPGARVVLGGEEATAFAVHSLTTRLDVVRASTTCPPRVKLLGAADTNTAVRAEIRGGVSVADECSFRAPSDGFLEVALKGVVSYTSNSAYGDYPDQDGLCHVCAMVGLDLRDVNNQPLMPEVFNAFRPGVGMSGKLVCRPWIVPSSELADADGRMTSRLTVPMRRGDTFRVCLQFSNFTPADGLSDSRAFVPMAKASWVDGGSWATAELVFRAIGGAK